MIYAVAAVLVGRLGGALLRRLFRQRLTAALVPRAATVASIVSSIWHYAVVLLGLGLVLHAFNIDLTTLLGAAGIAGIAVALGAQTLIKDWLAGFFLLAENQMAVDDYVAAAGVEGLVVAVGLRTSRLRDARGRIVIVPNGQITALTNYSRGGLGSVEIGIPLKEIEVAALVRDVRLCAVEEGLHDVSVQLGKVENGYGWVVVQFQYIRPTPDAMSLIRLTLVAALQKRGWRLSPP